jgi:hypothetical protein
LFVSSFVFFFLVSPGCLGVSSSDRNGIRRTLIFARPIAEVDVKKPPMDLKKSTGGFLLRDGVPGEIRTPDRRLRRPLLYPAELLGRDMEGVPGFEPGVKVLQTRALPLGYTPILGRSMGLEPTSAGATIRCVNHFATTAMYKTKSIWQGQ